MARRQHHHNKRQKPRNTTARAAVVREAPPVYEKKPPVEYGKSYILLENEDKQTFEYRGGQWVPHALSIAECRQSCLVKELPQKVNRMTRYEVRAAITPAG